MPPPDTMTVDPANPAANGSTPGQPGSGAGAHQPDAQSDSTPSSTQSSEQAPAPVDYFRQAFNNLRGYHVEAPTRQPVQAPPTQEKKPEAEGSEGARAKVPPSAEAKPGTTLPPSQEEPKADDVRESPEFKRAVQSEVDRILRKHNEEVARQRKEAEERELLETDPFAYRDKKLTEEQQARDREERLAEAKRFVNEQLTTLDREVMDPVFLALPKVEMDRILGEIARDDPIKGRGNGVKNALATLRKIERDAGRREGREQAAASLRTDQAFIKEILTRFGAARMEPDNTAPLPAASPASPFVGADSDMSGQIRRARANLRGIG